MDVKGDYRLQGLWNTYIVGLDSEANVLAELTLVGIFVLLLQGAHVIGDVLSEDVSTVDFSVEALVLSAVAWETLDGVGDIEATINSTLHGTEDASTGGGTSQTNVQVATESSWAIIDWFDQVFLTGHIGTASVQSVQAELVQDTAGSQQSSAVRSSVVGKTDLK